MTATNGSGPMVITAAKVASAQWLSPTFRRIELAAPELVEVGVDGELRDQRFKMVFPDSAGRLPDCTDADANWMSTWLATPPSERGAMRTYTVRALTGEGSDRRLVVDIAVHTDGTLGPGTRWALDAAPGDGVVIVAPRRGHAFGGIEFDAADAGHVLLVGDETAVPAVAGILESLPATARGEVYLEVPGEADRLPLRHPEGVTITWIPRDEASHGDRMTDAINARLGEGDVVRVSDIAPADVDPDLWETAQWSSSGEPVAGEGADHSSRSAYGDAQDQPPLYAWIAGESRMVTALRRRLVGLGLPRSQVAFMGYWRQGVAMRG